MTTRKVTTLIVGGGQAGLAMSRALTLRGIDHLILDRERVGHAWRARPWQQLRLQTPNWANALPGADTHDLDPDAFLPARAMAGRLETYAEMIDAPVEEYCDVLAARATGDGFALATNQGPFHARSLVIASGACARPAIPALAGGVPDAIRQIPASAYRRAQDVPEGGVLVVGGSASGVQIASELSAAGHRVTLAAGTHLRLPRRYRGRDIDVWLDAIGSMDERFDAVDDIARVRRTPSPQITGWPVSVDLGALQARGVELVGRLGAIRDGQALFSGGLAHACAAADLKLARLRHRIDTWVQDTAPASGFAAPERLTPEPLVPTPVPANARLGIDLRAGEIQTIVWATGYRPDLSWLDLPVFTRRGELDHQGGVVTGAPGLYALGLPFLRRRRSPLISGVGPDADDLADHLAARLRQSTAA
ncbi:MAG: NAD(P)/FAD-dependent oxidoreductase [Pseudomonadota bacterium]